MEEQKKRKTHTSTEVKARYNAKVYSSIGAQLPKQLVSDFKEKCKKNGDSQAQIIKDAIIKYLKEN